MMGGEEGGQRQYAASAPAAAHPHASRMICGLEAIAAHTGAARLPILDVFHPAPAIR